jgi:hypothetical protein
LFRKYGFTYAVLAFTIVAVGMYAVITGWKTNGSPEFRLVTVEGQAPEGKPFTVEGSYKYTRSISAQLNIGEQGVTYEPTRFHFQWFDFDTGNNEFGNTSEKRRFMSGKKSYGLFVEESSMLGYANSELIDGRWELDVAALDKESKKTTQFTLQLPKHDRVDYWFTSAIRQIDKSNISVYLGRNEEPHSLKTTNYSQVSRLIRLDIDLESQSITNEINVLTELAGLDPNADYRANFISFKDNIGLIAVSTSNKSNNSDSAAGETSEYYVFDFEDYSLRKLDIHDAPSDSYSMKIVDHWVDGLSENEGVIYYKAFKLNDENQELPASWKVDTHAWGANSAYANYYDDQYVRITYQNEKPSASLRGVALVDIKTGEVIYRGEVETDGTAEEQIHKINNLSLF